jgi:hypothetical protein
MDAPSGDIFMPGLMNIERETGAGRQNFSSIAQF